MRSHKNRQVSDRESKMRAGFSRSLLALVSILQMACVTPIEGLFPPAPNEPIKSIYLVSHGWHAGIVVRRADIPEGVWPQANEFPGAEYLEVGWGDMDYYMTPDAGFGTLLKAGLLPTASVLHVVGFSGPVTRYFPGSGVIRIDLSEAGFRRLSDYLGNSYALDQAGQSRPLGPSQYGDGLFYLSRETYHAFNTCNVWTARGLRVAGYPIRPGANLRVDTLMSNAAKFGTVIRARPDGVDQPWEVSGESR